MKTAFLLLLFGLVLAMDQPAAQADETGSSADKVTAAKQDSPRRVQDTVLKLAPADAWLVAYTADIGEAVGNPLVATVTSPQAGVPALLQAFSETFEGPAMLAISGAPMNPWSWRITLAAGTSLDRERFFERLGTELVARWNRSSPADQVGRMDFESSGRFGRLTLPTVWPVSLTITTREGLVFGSSESGVVEAWLEGGEASDSFADGEAFERLTAGFHGRVGSLLYFDVRTLIPLAPAPLDLAMPNLSKALQLDNVEYLALLAGESMGKTKTPSNDRPNQRADAPGPSHVLPPDLRLAIGVRAVDAGPWRFLAGAPSDLSLAKVFPPDTTLWIHGSMERATDLVEDLSTFAAVVDRVIADEYEEERADFKKETGFDPHSDFLSNFVEGWAFGGRIERDEISDRLLAVRLEDVKAFQSRMKTLRSVFALEITSSRHRGVAVHRAHRSAGPFSYAVLGDLLLVAPKARTVTRAIDASLDEQALSDVELFKAIRGRMSAETSKFVYLDVGKVLAAEASESEWNELAEAPADLRALIESPSAVALSVVPYEGMIAVDLVAEADTNHALTSMLTGILMPSLERARFLSARLVSMAAVKGLLVSCAIHSNDHKGHWPKSLLTLLEDGSITREMLSTPYESRGDGGSTHYLYRYVEPSPTGKAHPPEVVISEPEIHHGGAVFGYRDGHAEWVESPHAERLLAIMRGER